MILDPRRRRSTRRYSHRRHDPAARTPRGILGKLISGALKVVGGNAGGLAGGFINGRGPVVKLGGKSFDVLTEVAALAVGTGSEYLHGLPQDFLDGMTGGMAAVGDPAMTGRGFYSTQSGGYGPAATMTL